MLAILLLAIANIFMTIAWYGHLKYKEASMVTVIFVAWCIAFVEYCFQVPANRLGSAQFTTAQLKTIQEVLSLLSFSIFSVVYLKEEFKPSYILGFALILAGAYVIFRK